MTENEFFDPTPTAGQNQSGLFVGSTSTVSDNNFDDFVTAISVGGAPASSPTISGNEITGTRVGAGAGAGIVVVVGTPTIVGNRIDGPFFAMPNDLVAGIAIDALNPTGIPAATLRRNVVIGHRVGITIEDTSGPVTLEGDLIVQSKLHGLRLVDTNADDPAVGDATATNVTIVDTDDPVLPTEAEVLLFNANLTLDSSIIGGKAIDAQGSSVCALTFSRGPTTTGNSCETFQTSADPLFNDYHLTAASTLIDAGNPAPPPPESLDIDGGPRAVDHTQVCYENDVPRRDIGADEAGPGAAPQCAALTASISGKRKVKTRKKRARVTFSLTSSVPGATLSCSLDGAPFAPCGPTLTTRLRAGVHTLRARASFKDAVQEPPTSFTVKVKRKKPRPR